MALWHYQARGEAGKGAIVAGSLQAGTRREALRQLQSQGLWPVRLDEESAAPARSGSGRTAAKADAAGASRRREVVAPFNRHQRLPFLEALAELIEGGLSAGEAVRMLSARLQDVQLRALCGVLWARLGEGATLSRAMATQPAVFDAQTVNLIAAGEATGNLGDVLDRLIRHFHEQKELRQQLVAALLYPAFICVLAFGVMLIFLFFLLPRIQGLLSSLGAKLPWTTRLMVDGANFLLYAGPFILGALIAGAVALVQWRRTEKGRAATDRWVLQIPVWRELVVRTSILNFTHTLAVLLENGVTTSEALRLTERAIGNLTLKAGLREATDRVLEGTALSVSLAKTGFFPALITDRIAVGEQTGNLAPGLRAVAKTYQAELSRRLQGLTKLFAGTVLAFAFSFVAFLAVAIVMALLQVSSSFRI